MLILVMLPGLLIINTLVSPFIQMLPIKFDVDWPSRFRQENL